jgi:hypothetical protein
MTFDEVFPKLRDGCAYSFGHKNLSGYFFKAPDDVHSTITFWRDGKQASPTLMLCDFDDETDWYCLLAFKKTDNPFYYGERVKS